MEPMLAVWDGHGLGAGLLGSSGPTVAQNQLQPYVDDVMNELEYILGDVSTKYGALRASHGYPNPWKLNYVEVGNEDYLTGGEAWVSLSLSLVRLADAYQVLRRLPLQCFLLGHICSVSAHTDNRFHDRHQATSL